MRHLRHSAPTPLAPQAFLRLLAVSLVLAAGIGCSLACLGTRDALVRGVASTVSAGHAHDIEVTAPLGLAESDLMRIRGLAGVAGVEGSFEASCAVRGEGGDVCTLVVRSITDEIDTVTLVEGELPRRAGEVALLRPCARRLGIGVGDVLEVVHGEVADASGLAFEHLEVCGLVLSPEYLSGDEWDLGVSAGPVGVTDAVAFASRASFPAARNLTGFDHAHIVCADADADAVRAAVGDLGQDLSPVRLGRLRVLARALEEEGGQTTGAGQAALEGVSAEIDGARRRFEEATGELKAGEEELRSSAEALDEAQGQGERELTEAYEELQRDRASYEERMADFEAERSAMDEVSSTVAAGTDGLDEALRVFGQLRESYSVLTEELAGIGGSLASWDAADERGSIKDKRLELAQEDYAGFVSGYRSSAEVLAGTGGTLGSCADRLGIDLVVPELPGIADSLSTEDPISTVEAARAGLAVLGGFIDGVEGASREISGVTVSLVDPTGNLDEARAALDERERELGDQGRELDEREAELERRVAEFEERINDGRRELAENAERIEQDRAALAKDEAQLRRDQRALEGERGQTSPDETQRAELVGRATASDASGWRVTGAEGRLGLARTRQVGRFLLVASVLLGAITALLGIICLHAQLRRIVADAWADVPEDAGRVRLALVALSVASALLGVVASVPVSVVAEGALESVLLSTLGLSSLGLTILPVHLLATGAASAAVACAVAWHATRLPRTSSAPARRLGGFRRWRVWRDLAPYTRATLANCLENGGGMVGMVAGAALCALLVVTSGVVGTSAARTRAHYFGRVTDADVVVVLEQPSADVAESVVARLEAKGLACADAYVSRHQVVWPNGARSMATVMVPAFEDFYALFHPASVWGSPLALTGGAWTSEGAARSLGQGRLMVEGRDGMTLEVGVMGTCEVHLPHQRLVIPAPDYGVAFGSYVPNAVIVSSEHGPAEVRGSVADLAGVRGVVDLTARIASEFDALERGLWMLAAAGIWSSVALVVVGLYAADVTYVRKRHAELMSLGLEGFGSYDARSYLWRDGLVFSLVGVALGTVAAVAAGPWLVGMLEPEVSSLVGGVPLTVVLAGAALVLAALLATLALSLAGLRHKRS